jgi:hypothetical protein
MYNDVFARENEFGMPGQRIKYVKLDSGKFNGLAIFQDAPFAGIQSEATEV